MIDMQRLSQLIAACLLTLALGATALAIAVPTAAWADEWEVIDESDGIITSRKEVSGSSMLAFRGESDTDVHISRLLAVLLDANKGPEWVDLQTVSREVERISGEETVLYQVYDLSWPISDRDYLLRRITHFDAASKVATVTYNSVERADTPPDDCCVRAQALRTYWRLTAKPDGGTHVEVEVLTDPKGMLPAWVVNLVQRGWPRNSITGLTGRAAEADIQGAGPTAGW